MFENVTPDMIDVRAMDGGVRIRVRVQPKARRSAIDGTHGDALRVRLTAPPVDGKANAALIALLSQELGVARSAVSIVLGEGSRDKVVAVEGISVEQVRHVLNL